MKKDANLAVSGGDRQSSGDELDDMCEHLQSQYVLDPFFSVSGGKLFDLDSGIREGIKCEVGESESRISNDDASRYRTSSHDSMTNYCECSGLLGPLAVMFSRLKVLGTFSFDLYLSQERLTFSCWTLRVYHN